jgi:hypothetical protein
METIPYKKTLTLVPGKKYRITHPSTLLIKSVESAVEIEFGMNGEIPVPSFNREVLDGERPDIKWEISFRDSSHILRDAGNSLPIEATALGMLQFGIPVDAYSLNLLRLDIREFKIKDVADLVVNAHPYIHSRKGDVCCAIKFHSPALKYLEERKKSVVLNEAAEFVIEDRVVNTAEPISELSGFDEVGANEAHIETSADRWGLDSNLVRAIIYMETTHGWYDRLSPRKKSIRPMNVHSEFWKGLGIDEIGLKDAGRNIDAGCLILSRIRNRIRDDSIRKVASIYNFLGAERVTDYGGRVEQIFRERLWQRH